MVATKATMTAVMVTETGTKAITDTGKDTTMITGTMEAKVTEIRAVQVEVLAMVMAKATIAAEIAALETAMAAETVPVTKGTETVPVRITGTAMETAATAKEMAKAAAKATKASKS